MSGLISKIVIFDEYASPLAILMSQMLLVVCNWRNYKTAKYFRTEELPNKIHDLQAITLKI